jgi:aspartyl-tRNA(Asn)/glutamyl-tRNA(Gln) amidotransferase subunit A
MTRSVADAAALMDIIGRPHERDRYSIPASDVLFTTAVAQDPGPLRVGWSPDLGYAPVDAQVAALTREAVTGFGDIGWPVDEAGPGFPDPNEFFNTIIRAENYVATKELLRTHPDELDPGLREFTENGANISAVDYLNANQLRDDLCTSLARYFEDHDLLVTPTLAVPPFAIGTRPDKIAGRNIHGMSWVAFTYPFNLSGNPAASVPCGFTSNGLPVGLQIVGPRGADALVLQASAAFEKARPWAQHRPPVGGA